MVPGVCPELTASPSLSVVMVASSTDVALVTNPSVDGLGDCVTVKDTSVVSGPLDDSPGVFDDLMACAVCSVMPVDTPTVPVPITVRVLVCGP